MNSDLYVPCVVLVDISSSMDQAKEQLRDGLVSLEKSLNDLARVRADLCVIGFDNEAKTLVPFGQVSDYAVPQFECSGGTVIRTAVELGLAELESRKDQYKYYCASYSRALIFMLTGSGAVDVDNCSFVQLLQFQNDRKCVFFPTYVGSNSDYISLASLNKDGLVLVSDNFEEIFSWIGNSINCCIENLQNRIVLPNPKDYGLECHFDSYDYFYSIENNITMSFPGKVIFSSKKNDSDTSENEWNELEKRVLPQPMSNEEYLNFLFQADSLEWFGEDCYIAYALSKNEHDYSTASKRTNCIESEEKKFFDLLPSVDEFELE